MLVHQFIMLSHTIVPDDKYVFHQHIPYNTVTKYADPGYIVRVSDFKIIANLQKSFKSKSFDTLLDSIPCGINCCENSETDELESSEIFTNAKFTFRTYIERQIAEMSINTLCFVLTTNQYNDMVHEIKSLNMILKPEIIECWYNRSLSDRIDYVYDVVKLRNIFINGLQNIDDNLVTNFLDRWPQHTNYGWDYDDCGNLTRYVYYTYPKESIQQYITNGLYPWCELILNKKQMDSLDVILKKYPELQNDLNPKLLKRNAVVMLRNGHYAISYHEKSSCTLL